MSSSVYILVLSIILASLFNSNELFNTTELAIKSQNILLVTAHPDDETMFFAPTILSLTRKTSLNLFHLCLSSGNADGLGETRKGELRNSLSILGIDHNKQWIVDHPELQDNITMLWDASIIADVIKPFVLNWNINTILTFDPEGVSSHPNHKSLPFGAQTLIKTLSQTSSNPPRLFTLVTVPLAAKYISILGPLIGKVVIYSFLVIQKLEPFVMNIFPTFYPELAANKTHTAQSLPLFISGYWEYLRALQAMQAHRSQLVWFRWLYVAFSKYMWVNAWVEMKA
ncbi:N-acetylglucosaminylphosphatidylinositoldeacety la se [Phlegmacium glaucopus]|nr:N-acetylglucosaminylphosphatidylinositoldeacety la se [Phlegmacium glaucopus]